MVESTLSATRQARGTASSKKSQSASVANEGEQSQLSRAMALGSYFVSGLFAINASQFLGAPLYLINEDWYNAWISFTKESWGLLIATMTQCWAPTIVRVSGDKTVRGQILQSNDGDLLCKFPNRLILIANHQIYTDWLYLWWIGYTAGMHGHIFIILKESLKRIPVIGWGMQFYQFIFLKRNWELDKPRLALHLEKLNKPADPMWLMIFPEGTNLAPSTREASKRWADRNGLDDMRYQLLPRSTGLHFCLQNLRETVEYVYDCTIAYEGVPIGQYAQDIFTVQGSYLDGHPPASVNMYWRRFRVDTIPIDNPLLFDRWLRDRWTEKDMLLSIYHQTGRFPADNGAHQGPDGKVYRGAGYVETEVKSVRWYEFLKIFAPVGLFAMVLYMFYGAIPKQVVSSNEQQAWGNSMTALQKVLTEKSRKKESALLNEPSSKVKTDILKTASRSSASSLPDKFKSGVKADSFIPPARKPASSLPDKSSKADKSTLVTRKAASSLPEKPSSNAKMKNSTSISQKIASSVADQTSTKAKFGKVTSTTRKIGGSVQSKPSTKVNANSPVTATRNTAISLPSKVIARAKADKPVATTQKIPPKLGISDAGAGAGAGAGAEKSRTGRPVPRALTTGKNAGHIAAPKAESEGKKSLTPKNHKVVAKNQPIIISSSSKLSKDATPASKKVIPKLPQPKGQPQPNRKQPEAEPGKKSASKSLQSQKTVAKGAIKSPNNVAIPKTNPTRLKVRKVEK